MDNLIKEELYRMKYLFSHERGRVISEQKDGYLLNEAIGELPKDQAEADKFKVWLKQNHPEFRCRVGKSKGMSISAAPNRPYQGPCFKDVWKTYGEAFMGTTTQSQTQDTTTPSQVGNVITSADNTGIPTPTSDATASINAQGTNQPAGGAQGTNQPAGGAQGTNQPAGGTNQQGGGAVPLDPSKMFTT